MARVTGAEMLRQMRDLADRLTGIADRLTGGRGHQIPMTADIAGYRLRFAERAETDLVRAS